MTTHFKKSALAAAALAVMGAAGFAAAPQAEARGITVALANSFTTLDPYDATDVISRQVSKSFYEGLFVFDKDMKPQPQLLNRMKSVPTAWSTRFGSSRTCRSTTGRSSMPKP